LQICQFLLESENIEVGKSERILSFFIFLTFRLCWLSAFKLLRTAPRVVFELPGY
jgi:hypothetical protein